MKERSKERIAELLMDELLTRLSERGNLKRSLGEMTDHPIEQLIDDLVGEFEKLVERYQPQSVRRILTEPVESHSYGPALEEPASIPLPVQVHPAPAASRLPEPPDHPELSETHIGEEGSAVEEPEAEPLSVVEPEPVHPEPNRPGADVSDFRSRLEELARRVEHEYLEKLEQESAKHQIEERVETKEVTPPEFDEEFHQPVLEQEHPRAAIDVGPGEGGRPSRIPYRIDDSEYLYVHGVMTLPVGESPCEHPFMLEEKGVDGREFAFAIDYEGLRFFLSKISQKEMNVSRKGVLLLGKSESLQLRGVHENILNELRLHGIVLPMEFGTVARGKSDLSGLAGRFHESIVKSLERLAASRWWTVTMSVLDSRIAQLFADEGEQRRERDGRERSRLSYASATLQPKKYDVKLLEKLLQKEKRLSESVHQELSSVAERSEIQHMVGLGSGTSDDWKLILQATYLVPGSIGFQRLSRSVTDLQYRHILFEPMLSVTGDVQDFSFLKK